ncbi:hypothetical protein EBR25_00845 [bacterium]|nr:hypothetical protein [bacterium]
MSLSSSLAEEINRVIQSGKQTKYSIAVGSGVDHAVLRRFLTGERDIKLKTADRLAKYLNLELKNRK